MQGSVFITGDPDADRFLNTDPLALLVGMLLDQQVPMGWAFRGPHSLRGRLGDRLDATAIAALDPEAVVAAFCAKPALHRYPAVMGRRTHALCAHLVEHHHGRADHLWDGITTGAELSERVRAVPGFGEEKAQIFVALLAKRFAIAPVGWEKAAGVFSDAVPRSVADCTDAASLGEVKAFKQAMREAKRDKQGRPVA